MFVDHHQHHLKWARKALSTLAAPILVLADMPSELAAWGGDKMMSRSQLRRENARLRSDALVLQAQLQKLIALESENARLRSLLGVENKQVDKRLVAEVIGVDHNPFDLELLINKGSNDEVFIGQTVIDALGVVGQVVEVSAYSSRVLMIADATHAVPVVVDRNGVRATLSGMGRLDLLELQFVPDTTDIVVGDLLLTSGLGRRFPAGYPVAEVVSVEHHPGEAFATIFAAPKAQLTQSAALLLVWSDATYQVPGEEK